MEFKIGDLVTRKSHQHDIVFKIMSMDNGVAILKGLNVRLCADSEVEDLSLYDGTSKNTQDDGYAGDRIKDYLKLDREDYFYLPGKVLHIDGDQDYLDRCLKLYKDSNILAFGVTNKEDEIPKNIRKYLDEINPDIVVITGHDALNLKKGDKSDLKAYKNSGNFVQAVREARKYEKAQDKLIIIAGACQSDYEELIKAGANFASSPKRINIHALDPAIIATIISLSSKTEDIDLIGIIEKTKYGKDGMGGIKTTGTMYIGFPR